MGSTMVTVRMPAERKARATEALKALGHTPSSAINLLFAYVAQYGRLPFDSESAGADAQAIGPAGDSPAPRMRVPIDPRFMGMSGADLGPLP
ncbi:hypothetical protein HLV38_02730 [Berryella wangjianweii]|uniref:Uncharacterized protein n=1 Tax=Berryella wangjianweii TaxID=2734634 RepID=A0A6M8J652_9ACTN|nr:type II toxin-antitoxin system RelB/DinJ family antitoxin [Berryella wangjianweii]NPD32796.1 hypothetical protein [Eggerthellaceae bacterium zg-997]QKF07158.1 hypothetical protein HLV38_02730 [Berryella wangjianweii]